MTLTPQEGMQRALAAYERGAWGEAELLCRRVLDAKADYFDALNLLGIIAAQTRRTQEAAELLGCAVAANPTSAAAYINYGITLQELKRLDEALDSYNHAIKIKPDYAQAHYNRGLTLQELKRLDEALDSYDRALTLKPDFAQAYNNRGSTLTALKRLDEALDSYNHALEIKPDYAEAYNNRGVTLQELERLDEALDSYDHALTLKPASAETYFNRGVILQELARLDQALDSYDHALEIKPDYAEAYSNRALTLQELGRLDEALDSCDRALTLKPDFAQAYNNRGVILQELKRLDEALDSYDHALKIKPDYAEAYNNRGVTLQQLKRLDEALDSYDRALRIKPDYAEAYYYRGDALIRLGRVLDAAQCLTQLMELAPDFSFAKGRLLHAKMLSCEWNNLSDLYGSIRQDIAVRKQSIAPFEYQGICDSEQDLRTCAEIYAAKTSPKKGIRVHTKRMKRHGKIRVGYLSGEFRSQATSILMTEVFELHDRNRFEILAFDNGWDDGSEIRARINQAFDEILDIARVPDSEAAATINAREIDILVNLNGYFGEARQGIFACKPSPIQVNYLGFPGTLGAEYIDYLIADSTLIPSASRQYYSEKIAYLPNSYQANDRKRAIAEKTFLREDLGLPRTGFVFCCFNSNYKITPGTFDGWMRILRKIDGSVLWLLEDSPTAGGNLRIEASKRGVSAERLIFAKRMPLAEHLARHRAADLFIDTLPYNAHTTASDALWAGLPLLTCIGKTFPGRVAASLLKAVELPELITTTQEQYEALAVELATNPERVKQIKDKLERNRLTTPLFDAQLFTKHIEDAYGQMYERYQADLPADHIHVLR